MRVLFIDTYAMEAKPSEKEEFKDNKVPNNNDQIKDPEKEALKEAKKKEREEEKKKKQDAFDKKVAERKKKEEVFIYVYISYSLC